MRVYKVPLRLEPQPEGGYTVTSPALHGLVTEGETVAEALAHAAEALKLVLEDDDAEGTPLPEALRQEVQVIAIDYPWVARRSAGAARMAAGSILPPAGGPRGPIGGRAT